LLQLCNLTLHEVEQRVLLRYAVELGNHFIRSVSVPSLPETVDGRYLSLTVAILLDSVDDNCDGREGDECGDVP
jgi:hypothetical protein